MNGILEPENENLTLKKVKKLLYIITLVASPGIPSRSASLGSVFKSGTHRELMFAMKSFESFALRITSAGET